MQSNIDEHPIHPLGGYVQSSRVPVPPINSLYVTPKPILRDGDVDDEWWMNRRTEMTIAVPIGSNQSGHRPALDQGVNQDSHTKEKELYASEKDIY